MNLNADFDQRVVIKPADYQWVPSPVAGVTRMMFDRIGDEIARATSLVRYDPNSEFPEHQHGGGEEVLVVEGEFADEHGSYPAGTYIRNPIGTRHSPRVGPGGAVIFGKLHQFDQGDTEQKAINTRRGEWLPGLVDGLQVLPLHEFASPRGAEHVALVQWAPNSRFNEHGHFGGEEIFVLEGRLHDEHGAYPAGSWIRSPHQSRHQPYTREQGALIYVKTGHIMPGFSRFLS